MKSARWFVYSSWTSYIYLAFNFLVFAYFTDFRFFVVLFSKRKKNWKIYEKLSKLHKNIKSHLSTRSTRREFKKCRFSAVFCQILRFFRQKTVFSINLHNFPYKKSQKSENLTKNGWKLTFVKIGVVYIQAPPIFSNNSYLGSGRGLGIDSAHFRNFINYRTQIRSAYFLEF